MAKLYAELTSDKGGRVVGKGGNECIKIKLHQSNYHDYFIKYENGFITVIDGDGEIVLDKYNY